MTNHSLAIYCESQLPTQKQRAKLLQQQLGLPLLLIPSFEFFYLLVVTDHHVELRQTNSHACRVYVDFLSAAAQYRFARSSRKNELIARAVGIKAKQPLSVIDATAGLGQDGFVLANLGCTVHYLERSPVIAALLQDGIERFLQASQSSLSFSLTTIDAIDYLQQLDEADFPDVIYLDPMFPARQESALVKKEMRLLQDIVGSDLDTAVLFEWSLKCAKKRVVVKRSKLAPTITTSVPDLVFKGQSCRFDVYFVRS